MLEGVFFRRFVNRLNARLFAIVCMCCQRTHCRSFVALPVTEYHISIVCVFSLLVPSISLAVDAVQPRALVHVTVCGPVPFEDLHTSQRFVQGLG